MKWHPIDLTKLHHTGVEIYDISSKITSRFQLWEWIQTLKVCTQHQHLRTFLQTTRPETDLSPRDRREPALVQCGQVWLGLAWKEEGAGNTDNDHVCIWTVMCRTFTDLPLQITPYHSALSGWSRSRRVRPAGCPGGNEVCWSNCSASAFDLLFLSTGAQFWLLQMPSLIYLLVVFWTPTPPRTHAARGLTLIQSSYTYVHFKTP